MKAVNLIPAEARRGGAAMGAGPFGPAYAVLAVLAGALILVTIYVLTDNTIADRKAQLARVQRQAAQQQAIAAKLSTYVEFEKLAQERALTVHQIASTRFDWHGALSDLSKVVPAGTSLQSLLGSVAPGASVSGAGGTTVGSAASTSSLRSAIAAPAFELRGCTASQDDVARLMSRLRLIDGVTRVTLSDSQKQAASQGASPVSGRAGASSGTCPANAPAFDVVVFFKALPGAGPTGATPASTGSGGGAR